MLHTLLYIHTCAFIIQLYYTQCELPYIYIFHTRTLCNTFNFNIIIQLFASVALHAWHGAMHGDGDDGRFHNDDDELDPIDRAPFRLAS